MNSWQKIGIEANERLEKVQNKVLAKQTNMLFETEDDNYSGQYKREFKRLEIVFRWIEWEMKVNRFVFRII